MGTTEKVATFVVDFDYGQLPARGIEQAKMSILDTMGTALVGGAGPIGTIVKDFVRETGGNPQARLIGSGLQTSVLDAALANGTLEQYCGGRNEANEEMLRSQSFCNDQHIIILKCLKLKSKKIDHRKHQYREPL